MTEISHPAWIEIDLDQFGKNLQAIRRRIGGALLCLPVKANAYGHGLVPMGLAAERFGVDLLAVACLKEAIALKEAGVKVPLLVLGAIHENQMGDLIENELEFSISSKYKANLVREECRKRGRQCRVHLEVDTGMNRTGMRPDTAVALYQQLQSDPCFQIRGIYSHFATADLPKDPFVQTQLQAFQALRAKVGPAPLLWHMANSGGVYFHPESHLDMVRPGLLAYGLTPDGSVDAEIRPCFSLKAKISYFKVVAEGEGISYGHLYITKKQTRIVTIPVGYGDGYQSALSSGGSVLIRGERFPVAGKICMDQFMVDIGMKEAYVGEEVVLIGKGGTEEISLWELSTLAKLSPYEILCQFNERLPRHYRTGAIV